jgi:hypothetical protein
MVAVAAAGAPALPGGGRDGDEGHGAGDGGPTVRHCQHRHMLFCDLLVGLVEKAAYGARMAGRMHGPRGGLQLSYTVSEPQEEDNLKLAQAAREILKYLDAMKQHGWITTRKAMELAYKFAGEVVDVEAMLKGLEGESFDTSATHPSHYEVRVGKREGREDG